MTWKPKEGEAYWSFLDNPHSCVFRQRWLGDGTDVKVDKFFKTREEAEEELKKSKTSMPQRWKPTSQERELMDYIKRTWKSYKRPHLALAALKRVKACLRDTK